MNVAGIHVYGQARAASKGGVHTFRARSTDEPVNVAVLPFLSQRYAVRAAEIIANTPSQNVGAYDQLVRDVLANLTGAFTPDAVNIIMAHLTCTGGTFGGGERPAQSIMEYHVLKPPSSPSTPTTWPWDTCTADSTSPPPARCTTAALPTPSTSASRTTPTSSASSRSPRHPRPDHRHPRHGLPQTAHRRGNRRPADRRPCFATARTTSGSWSPSPPTLKHARRPL